MNAKVLSSLSAALIVSSLVSPVMAEPLGEHPAVVVARTWNQRGIDPNTFIVAPPASTQWVSEAPKTADNLAHASESPKLHWSAAIGTGHAAGTIETSSGNPTVAATHSSAAPHWTASIGTGTAATSRSAVPNTSAASSSGTQPMVAATHWTSKIGSGHPFASASPAKYTSVANTR
ncbi:MAG TPA: hypothetical protein VGI23_13230 [Steroidobacteraceae bacterium]